MIRIIIVDDHVLFREGLRSIIGSDSEFEVVALAGSVQEATDLVLALRPDVVLMDFYLPDGSGVDATRAIMAEYRECKIIFLTMSEKDADLFAAVRSGAKGFISKNVPISKLLIEIRAVQNGASALSSRMTMRIMEEFARTNPVEIPQDPRLAKLSGREADVLKELATGRTNQEIAQRLFLTENTVKCHVHAILSKLSLSDRKSAGLLAMEYGFVKNDDRAFVGENLG